MLNSLIGLALFYTTFNLPVGVYVMRNSFLQVPREIVDAARVDGASVTRTLLSVLRPLGCPGSRPAPSMRSCSPGRSSSAR
jgi:multiple sugar transport system permease protein